MKEFLPSKVIGMNNSHTGTILLSLLAGGAIHLALSSPGGARKLLKMVSRELKQRKNRQRFFWTLAYLRRKQYIDYRETADGTITIVLTEDGRRRALRYKFDELALPREKHWDGKWRIIAFDVPEKKRQGRDALREKMRELGCVQLRKSLWAWPYECRDAIDFIAETFHIAPHVHYIIAESITSEKFLKYKFNLL